MQSLFIGVDAGASKCQVCIEDQEGRLLSRAQSGGASIRYSVDQAWRMIRDAIQSALREIGLKMSEQTNLHLGIGIAGTELPHAYHEFIRYPHGFKEIKVASDAHIACLGAHAGKEGAIMIAGTGVVGYQIWRGEMTRVSGWGFPHDDLGGGAWLGMMAVRQALQYLDGRTAHSALAEKIHAYFSNREKLVAWANAANSADFATLAPFVIELAKQGEVVANELMCEAGREFERVWLALCKAREQIALPCALIGGVASSLQKYISPSFQACLVPAQHSPEVGAIWMLRQKGSAA